MQSDLDAGWREHDEWWKEQNRRFLDEALVAEGRGDRFARDMALLAFYTEEEQRLKMKEHEMRRALLPPAGEAECPS